MPKRIAPLLDRLQALLPLAARQAALPAEWRALHRYILQTFAARAHPPDAEALFHAFPLLDVDAVLARLAADDLIVCEDDDIHATPLIRGAYPFTTEPTLHQVNLGGLEVHAMCAIDALAMAAMFDVTTEIVSCCVQSGQRVRVHQSGARLLEAEPGGLRVGLAWQETGGCAAHSLCREMVFLADAAAAQAWCAGHARREVLSLSVAQQLAAAFFTPLMR